MRNSLWISRTAGANKAARIARSAHRSYQWSGFPTELSQGRNILTFYISIHLVSLPLCLKSCDDFLLNSGLYDCSPACSLLEFTHTTLASLQPHTGLFSNLQIYQLFSLQRSLQLLCVLTVTFPYIIFPQQRSLQTSPPQRGLLCPHSYSHYDILLKSFFNKQVHASFNVCNSREKKIQCLLQILSQNWLVCRYISLTQVPKSVPS